MAHESADGNPENNETPENALAGAGVSKEHEMYGTNTNISLGRDADKSREIAAAARVLTSARSVEVIRLLCSTGNDPHPDGERCWRGPCPGHRLPTDTLLITEMETGTILECTAAGCDIAAMVEEDLGLEPYVMPVPADSIAGGEASGPNVPPAPTTEPDPDAALCIRSDQRRRRFPRAATTVSQPSQGPDQPGRYGYLAVTREDFVGRDPLWEEERVFSRYEAWLDLRAQAAYAPHTMSTKFGVDHLERGEVAASGRFLADRWRWNSLAKVQRFLEWCEKAGRITSQRMGRHGMVYRIVGYDSCQASAGTNESANESASESPASHPRVTHESKQKQVKQEKQVKTTASHAAVAAAGESSGSTELASEPTTATAAPQDEHLNGNGASGTAGQETADGSDIAKTPGPMRPAAAGGSGYAPAAGLSLVVARAQAPPGPVRVRDAVGGLTEVAAATTRRVARDAYQAAVAGFVFAYWQARLEHRHALFDRKRESTILQRLREVGGDPRDLLYAIDGALTDDFLMGRDPRNAGHRYDGIGTLFKSRAQVERLAEKIPAWRRGEPHPREAEIPKRDAEQCQTAS